MQSYSDFLRSRMEHVYTEEEIDQLFSVVEEAAENHTSIDFYKIEHILCPGDIVQAGFSHNASYEVLFEIYGLRWKYNGKVYRALISPRARYGKIPEVEWYIPITLNADTGSSWSRTHMRRRQYRCYNYCGEDAGTKIKGTRSMYERFYGKTTGEVTHSGNSCD